MDYKSIEQGREGRRVGRCVCIPSLGSGNEKD